MKTMNGFLFSKVIGYPEAFNITPLFLSILMSDFSPKQTIIYLFFFQNVNLHYDGVVGFMKQNEM